MGELLGSQTLGYSHLRSRSREGGSACRRPYGHEGMLRRRLLRPPRTASAMLLSTPDHARAGPAYDADGGVDLIDVGGLASVPLVSLLAPAAVSSTTMATRSRSALLRR